MIPTRFLTTSDGVPAYDAHVCCPCRAILRFVRSGSTTDCLVPVEERPGVDTDDLFVWTALTAGACGCRGRLDRWRYAPAIPEPRRVRPEEIERRARAWTHLGQRHLAAWAVPACSRWAAEHAPTPLHALAWSLLSVTNDITVARFVALGASGALEQLEWARAGVRSPGDATSWLDAGALDAHDVACRTRAGETPCTLDVDRTGCEALAAAWPDTRPATTECARRLGVPAGPAIARLTVALPTGGAVELYESTRNDEPVLAAVTVDVGGQEAALPRIVVPHVAPPATRHLQEVTR